MATRSRREISESKKRKLEALNKIKKVREGAILSSDDDEEDDNIYDVVTEEQYKKIVNDRRKGEEFVVDDDGTGYYDHGEEVLFDVAEGEEANFSKEASIKDPRARQRMRQQRKKASLNAAAAKGNHKLGAMFLGMSGHTSPSKKRQKTAVDAAEDLDLDAELDSLNASDAMVSTAMPRRAANALAQPPKQQFASVRKAISMKNFGHSRQNLSSATTTATSQVVVKGEPETTASMGGGLVDIDEEADEHAASMVEANQPNKKPNDAGVHSTLAEKDENTGDSVNGGAPTVAPQKKEAQAVEEDSDIKMMKSRKKALFLAARQKAAAKSAAKAMETVFVEDNNASESSLLNTQAKGGWFDVASNSNNSAPSSQESLSSYTFATAKDLPTLQGVDEDGDTYTYTRMYYIDAYADEYSAPGKIHLFGKVWLEDKKRFVSACVEVSGLQRQLFFLPKAADGESEPDMGALYNEISDILSNKVIPRGTQGEKFKCKPVVRKYAFEYDGIPREKDGTKYMKVLYNAKFPMLDLDSIKGKHFSHIFGTKTTSLENFIIKRKLMGPCWIDIRDPMPGKNTSWAKLEGRVDDPKLISVSKEKMDPPPLTVMSLSVKTYLNSKNHNHEIAMISAITHQDVLCHKPTPNEMDRRQISNFTLVRAIHSGLEGGVGTLPPGFSQFVRQNKGLNLKILPNERAMLSIFMNKIQVADPDIIVGHAIKDHDLDVMMHRMAASKVNTWSKLGRLKLSKVPRAYQRGANSGLKNFQRVSPGRLIVDTYHCAKDVLQLREQNFKLNTLAKKYLKIQEPPEAIYAQDVPRYYSTRENLLYLKKHTENFAYMALHLMFRTEMLPLSKQLTNIGGNLWIRTLTGGRAERIEYLLLHEFHNRKYIVPDKERPKKKAGDSGGRKRGKAKYSGGLVLEPKKGLYDKYVLLLDFNSLYPSIIQEFNLCYTTVTRDLKPLRNQDQSLSIDGVSDADEVKIPDLPNRSEHTEWGVLPTVIRTLIQRRSVVKKLLKKETNKEMKNTLNVRQLALKLTANSMYGCLGFSASRFYAAPIAALVTSQGREILQNTVDLASGMGLNVIYGDTDSIMIYTGSDDWDKVQQLGKEVKKAVNKKYKLLEIEIDGVFKSMLLLKKKKYAALIASKDRKTGKIHLEKETKGLDLVRRDWCGLSKEVGLFVLDHVLSGKDREGVVAAIHEELQSVARKVREGSVPLEKFTITKGLNKNPKDYADRKGMPHLFVALEMVRRGRPVNVGDHIPYVITAEQEGVKTTSFAERARHPDDLVAANKEAERTGVKPKLRIDTEWYLSQQILPPTSRLVDPIEGTSQAMIAEQLGLDSRKYGISSFSGDLMDEDMIGFTPSSQMSDEERFKNAKPLTIFCPKCEQTSSFSGVYRFPEVDSYEDAECGFKCPTPGCHYSFSGTKLQNILAIAIRQYCNEYYDGWTRCDDGTCQTKTKQQSCIGNACIAPGCNSTVHEIYPASELYTQLKYFELLFDTNAFGRKLQEFNNKREAHRKPKVIPHLTEVEKESFKELRSVVQEYLGRSDYTWIKPNLWNNIFGSKRIGASKHASFNSSK